MLLDRNNTPQSPQGHYALRVGGYASTQALGNSQESFLEGLSPELSDYGDHSNELDTTPGEAKILCAGYSVGLSIDFDDKNSCIVVKSVSKVGRWAGTVQPQGYYNQRRTREEQMGKLPPPYLFPHQAQVPPQAAAGPGRMMVAPPPGQSPYGAMVASSQAPPPQMSWSLQQQQIAPQG